MQVQNQQRFSWALGFGLVLWMIASDVATASTFEAGVLEFSFDTGNCIPVLGPSPASGSWSNSISGTGTASATGEAEGGTLRGVVTASSVGTSPSFDNFIAACFRVETLIDDIIISGPGSAVSTQVSAHLTGTIASMTTIGGLVASTGGLTNASVQAFTVAGASLGAATAFGTGSVNDAIVDTTLTTAVFSAPVNQAFAVKLTLYGQAGSRARLFPGEPAGTASCSNDFGGTLNFVEFGPVFTLPAGFTANSADGQIVDNVFVGNPPAVPALGGLSLSVLATVLLAFGVRRLATGAGS